MIVVITEGRTACSIAILDKGNGREVTCICPQKNWCLFQKCELELLHIPAKHLDFGLSV